MSEVSPTAQMRDMESATTKWRDLNPRHCRRCACGYADTAYFTAARAASRGRGFPLHTNAKFPRARRLWGILVRVAGFEPTASWTRTKRDTKLRHTRRFCVSPTYMLSRFRCAAQPRYNRNFVSAQSGCKCLTAQRPLSKLRHTRIGPIYYTEFHLVCQGKRRRMPSINNFLLFSISLLTFHFSVVVW